MVNKASPHPILWEKGQRPFNRSRLVVQENHLRGIPLPGTRLEFEDLQVEFLVDEDLQNLMEIHKWLYGIGYPDSFLDQIYDLTGSCDASIRQQNVLN